MVSTSRSGGEGVRRWVRPPRVPTPEQEEKVASGESLTVPPGSVASAKEVPSCLALRPGTRCPLVESRLPVRGAGEVHLCTGSPGPGRGVLRGSPDHTYRRRRKNKFTTLQRLLPSLLKQRLSSGRFSRREGHHPESGLTGPRRRTRATRVSHDQPPVSSRLSGWDGKGSWGLSPNNHYRHP